MPVAALATRRLGSTARALLLLLSCLGGAAVADTPKDILVVAQSLDDLVSLDPAEGFELSGEQLFGSLYQRLVQPDPEHPEQLQGVLAERWNAGQDGHSLTFELRQGACFANGDPVRAEDVAFSLSRAVKLNRSPAFILNELGWSAADVDGHITAIDARHVRLSWSANVGTGFALNILSATVASIVDQREALSHQQDGDLGNGWLKSHSAGSGPFAIRRYLPREALVLDANPRSPGDAPLLKTLIIRNIADAASRRLLVDVGDADIARDLGPDQVAALKDRPGLKTVQFPSATVHYLIFNTASAEQPALANPALWEAARWLIDYQGLADHLLQKQFSVHQAFLADGLPGALEATPYHLDVARARAILAGAGLDHGVKIRLSVFNQPPFIDIAQSLQASFAQAGISLEIQASVGSEVYGQLRSHRYQAAWLYWIPDYFDAHSTASAFALAGEQLHNLAWRAGWAAPGLSPQTLAAVAEPDPQQRMRMYQAIQAQVQRSSPFVLALQARTQLVMRANVHGYRQGLDADMVYYDKVSKS